MHGDDYVPLLTICKKIARSKKMKMVLKANHLKHSFHLTLFVVENDRT